MTMSRSARRRTVLRAVAEWRHGRPHAAWSVLDQAGMREHWPEFQRSVLAQARRRYVTAMRR